MKRPLTALVLSLLGGVTALASSQELSPADLIVLEGNPVATPSDIRKVRLVFKDGLGYDAAKLTEAIAGQVGIR